MNKVTIEITAEGWTTRLSLNGKEFIERHEADMLGATCTEGDFENEEDIPDGLCSSITGLTQFDIMRELAKEEA